ncbi:hypothetical protein SAMN05444336_103268 [Albimonas donghaensis]|uniref:Uncharacterized protein n=1 Tax=Albimonas donghaensis TaxID=356660 RepID=A0A1H2YWD6_9RHOB|nr:hypothetical protein SAMN05444336_103268 [Albimonas donghaensis]
MGCEDRPAAGALPLADGTAADRISTRRMPRVRARRLTRPFPTPPTGAILARI